MQMLRSESAEADSLKSLFSFFLSPKAASAVQSTATTRFSTILHLFSLPLSLLFHSKTAFFTEFYHILFFRGKAAENTSLTKRGRVRKPRPFSARPRAARLTRIRSYRNAAGLPLFGGCSDGGLPPRLPTKPTGNRPTTRKARRIIEELRRQRGMSARVPYCVIPCAESLVTSARRKQRKSFSKGCTRSNTADTTPRASPPFKTAASLS